jgi:anti-sigma regulatory factor (Ser/Thr protein kinase)
VILPVSSSAPRLARSELEAAVPHWELSERQEDVRLALTEIVANAVRHARLAPGGDRIRLIIDADEGRVRIEVEQATPAIGVRRTAPHLNGHGPPGGFGLNIVEALADRWGVEQGPPGYVWLEWTTVR